MKKLFLYHLVLLLLVGAAAQGISYAQEGTTDLPLISTTFNAVASYKPSYNITLPTGFEEDPTLSDELTETRPLTPIALSSEINTYDPISFLNPYDSQHAQRVKEFQEQTIAPNASPVTPTPSTSQNTKTMTPLQGKIEFSQQASSYDQGAIGLDIRIQQRKKYPQLARVFDNSPAQRGGLRAGDKILEVNGYPTKRKNKHYVSNLIPEIPGYAILFKVKRGRKTLTLNVDVAPLDHAPNALKHALLSLTP